MLTPEQLTACTEDIVELYRQLEDSIIQKIVKALTKGTFTEGKADLVLRLQQSGMLYDDIVKEVANHSGLSDEAVRVLFEDASVQSVAFDNKIYKEAGIDVVNQMSPAALHVLEANIEKTGSFLKNLTKTTATASQQSFISACTLAEMQIESGALSYTEAVRQAIHNVIDNGAEVLYPTGHHDKLDVAVRRAALTGVGQTTGEISRRNAEELGCDLMEITAHFGARPSHAEWQGKIVSLSGREGYLSLSDIGYGTGAGFKGWNCRHDWFPFFEDISEKAYSDKELEQRKNETVIYNDKTMSRYDAEQKQRAMERQIRKERSKLAGLDTAIKSTENEELKTSLKNDFDNLSVKLKSHEAKYKDFSFKTGLPPQKQRLQMYGFNRSVSQKAVHANFRAIEKEESKIKYLHPDTVVNKKTIRSAAYRRRIDKISNNTDVNRAIWNNAQEILLHRSGTKFEDLAFIDSETGKSLINTSFDKENFARPSKRMEEMLKNAKPYTIIGVHNHPGSSVPSIPDLKACANRKYKYGIVICHNGTIYKYSVDNNLFNEPMASSALDRLEKTGYNSRVNELFKNAGIEMEVL